MRRLLLAVIAAVIIVPAVPATPAFADGCYICTSGSACGRYCRYSGRDTWKNRKKCKKAGCKIGGSASCPTGVNIKVCTGSLKQKGWRYASTSLPKHLLLANVIGDRRYQQCLPR